MVGPYVETLGNHVCVVVYPTAEDVTAEKSEPLIPELEAAGRLGPIGLLIEVPPLRMIHPSMVAFIISMMSSGRVNSTRVGVVAKSAVVRIALRAIQTALKVYGKEIEIAMHETREQGVAWAMEGLAGAPP